MSDQVEQFEFILKKKSSTKLHKSLYSDNTQHNKHNFKPQDVISSVSKQLKAIQVADSLNTEKSVSKGLQKYKKSSFLSVNKLPVYEEVPKTSTKFDTQCVSDMQLINIIEDAEIIDVHRGMTQEFETSFCYYTEKQNIDENDDLNEDIISANEESEDKVQGSGIRAISSDTIKKNSVITAVNVPIEDKDKVTKDIESLGVKESTDKGLQNIKDVICGNIVNSMDNNEGIDTSISIISPIMCYNNVKDKETPNSKEENTQIDECGQILNDCIEIEDETDIERPLSPIFMHKNVKTKSKTPSPLIFNLERFENFEKIALPILEVNDLETAKHVIDSQILDKELHIKIDEEIQFNSRDKLCTVQQIELNTPVANKTVFKTHVIKNPGSDVDLEFIEMDKATSDELLNKVINEDPPKPKVKAESESLKDEILFSSDEEDSYVYKSFQDLPFTCALETSFYDQSDVLDKTMYVGFQTASNKSIQVFTDSFAQAKSILSNVANEEITVTDLVNNCDSSVKIGEKMDLDCEDIELNLGQSNGSATNPKNTVMNKQPETSNFKGFMTASKKEIVLSQKSLARCKKVFQDIDINEDFDEKLEVDEECKVVSAVSNTKVIKESVDDNIQTIDDDIIQEFENIEMSLEEDNEKEPVKNDASIGFKTASNKDIQISETALTKMKDVFKEIDFDEDLKEIDKDDVGEEKAAPKTTDDLYLKNVSDTCLGFKTASNKNIDISKDAITKTKHLFQDLGSIEFPNKSKNLNNENQNLLDFERPAHSNANFIGFKTANIKNIKISDQAIAKTKKIFNDIDCIELPNKQTINLQKHVTEESVFDQPSTSKASFVGFKTANNKNINISKDALAKTKNIFADIDSDDFKLPNRNAKNFSNDNCKESKAIKDEPFAKKNSFVGFKTANNKNIKITDAAMAKTKTIFKDIDSADFKFPDKEKIFNEDCEFETETHSTVSVPTDSFVGFKTALAKTKNIFKDIDSDDFKFPSKFEMNVKARVTKDDSNDNGVEMTDINKPSSFVGFKTANNKNVNISKEAIAKTKDIFDDIDVTDFNCPINIDEGPTNEARKTDQRNNPFVIEDFNRPSTSNAGFVGFKTANNRKIAISKESLAKTKNIFKDIDSTDFKVPEKSYKHNIDKDLAKVDSIDGTNKEMDKKTYDGKIVEINKPSTSKASFVGFKTANNKNINISKESLAKTKDIFKDIDSTENSNKELLKVKEPYPDLKGSIQPSTSKTSFLGFKTGNNKVINVSETALAKTKNIFQDIDSLEFEMPRNNKKDYPDTDLDENKNPSIDFEIPDTTVPKFQGFQTASNKVVKVSANALVESRKILEDDVKKDFGNKIKHKDILDTVKDSLRIDKGSVNDTDGLTKDSNPSPVFKGFQTANKKPVAISKEALAKSRLLFQDIDDHEPEFHGFESNDKEIENSQKVLSETKRIIDNAIKDCSGFKGFQTASEKEVVVSESSLSKSRKLFQDIENCEKNDEKKAVNIKFGFKTGTNRDVGVSEEAIARTKRRFSELDENLINNQDNIANMIDTQVLNNFEESMKTEDFRDTPLKSKRSGSPILSCPRAKRRKKFETPYSQKLPQPEKILEQNNINYKNRITFNENYKKNKKYTLQDLAKLSKNNDTTIDKYLLQFTYDNLLQFKFDATRNGLSNKDMTVELLKELFLNSVNRKLIPNGWLDNHLRLILWKLICYEIKFKSIMCNARNVIDQLKYRYDREIYNAERPALRKIFEKDDVATKTIILCVAAIYVDGVGVASPTTTNNMELLLTDGWYCIKANLDKMLAQLVCQGKIVVGTKIVTNGAELVNCEQGISPWEDTSAVRLKIFGNSTRRARWDARLGYHGNAAILSQLSSVKLDGGKVSKLRVFVTRVYPALYVEKFEDGSTVTRSERLEHIHQMKSEAERLAIMEKIYEEVEKEFSNQESQDSESPSNLSDKRTCLDSGSQIAKVMRRSKDPAEFRAGLTSSQSHLLEVHTSKRREILLQDIQQKIRDKVEKAGVGVSRNVVTLLKIRVAGVLERNGVEVTKGMISIWKPTDAVIEIIKEGAWIDVMNVVPTAVRYSEIQISAGRQSVFSTSKYKEPEKFKPYTKLLKRTCFTIKDLAQNPSMSTDYNEIDTVGFIFLIDPSNSNFDSMKQPFQNVFLADADKNIICINFWGGLKKFGYQNVLDTGQIVSCANLQKRAGNTRKSIPQFRVTEFSHFTKTPKNECARNLVKDLSKKFMSLDRRKFCDDCVVLKNNYSVIKLNNENISPYRFNNSDYNNSKNKIFIDSPLARPNKTDDFNLTGLDFESTFKQADTQNLPEEVLLRKKKVNEKIARLKMYGEPPPLSTIHIINRSKNASSSYKSPLISNNNNIPKSKSESAKMVMSKFDSCTNVASVEGTPEKGGNLNNSDLVLMNRTYVKSLNPVKINFDVQDNSIDHFAEEFDGSPPLSLD